jgi:hypothetical protein
MTIYNIEIKEIKFKDLKELHLKHFGFVVLGAGGPKEDWINGIEKMLKEEKIVDPDENTFSEAYIVSDNLNGKEGRTDLVLIFADDAKPNVGKLAMWRLSFGSVCWIDDFIVNYRKDYVSR